MLQRIRSFLSMNEDIFFFPNEGIGVTVRLFTSNFRLIDEHWLNESNILHTFSYLIETAFLAHNR